MTDNDPADTPAPLHLRPAGVSDDAVAAVGRMNEAVEMIERARGHLYTFHQLTGYADELLDDVVDGLRRTGHPELADRVTDELIGLNVVAGRWTFQVVEEYDDGYYRTFRDLDRAVRDEVVGGRRHVMEAEAKESRRTRGRPGHAARPRETDDPR
ncbi:hypothetical protein ACLFMI_15865 [Pseudonocardia nantongensis]|uniref:hypothetical protein n=1 Tax=Pseudonocardia nantongensis TaxID=1181885 RepID=UPI00397ADF7E